MPKPHLPHKQPGNSDILAVDIFFTSPKLALHEHFNEHNSEGASKSSQHSGKD
jgi:hypothetical protein